MKLAAILTLGGMTLALALGGCQSDSSTSSNAVLGDLSPELFGVTERYDDSRKNMAVANDLNSRMFWEDWGRAMYWGHPSRLSPLPIVFTSGKSP